MLPEITSGQLGNLLLLAICCILGYHYYYGRSNTKAGGGSRRPPVVSGSIPFIGHVWPLYRDAIGFIRNAHAECGPIFQYNQFGKAIIVLADPDLIEEYYRKDDDDGISFAETVNEAAREFGLISQGVAPNMMSCIVAYTGSVLRSKTITEILCVIGDEGKKTLGRLHINLDFHGESSRYLIRAFTRVMFNIEFTSTDALVDHVLRGQQLLTPLQTLTNILPAWLIRVLVKFGHPFVIPNDEYVAEIKKLISSSSMFSKSDSSQNSEKLSQMEQDWGEELVKIGQDYLKPIAGDTCPLSKPVAELLVFALVLLTDIFGLITSGLLVHWATNPIWKTRITEECLKFVSADKTSIVNLKDVVNSKILNAFLMESVRVNAAALISARTPLTPGTTIGNYDVSHAHVIRVAMKEHMQNPLIYKNPEEFDPDRYLNKKESYGSKWNLGWGNGSHKCPAKFLTMTIIKVTLIPKAESRTPLPPHSPTPYPYPPKKKP